MSAFRESSGVSVVERVGVEDIVGEPPGDFLISQLEAISLSPRVGWDAYKRYVGGVHATHDDDFDIGS